MSDDVEQFFALPDVGEGLTEAEIVTWRVAVGDEVNVNDVLVDIETAKSVVELPSPYGGVVTALLVEEGATVPVGTPIVSIAVAESETPADGREPALVGYGARTSGPRRRRRKVPVDLGTVVPLHGHNVHVEHRRVRAKPPVRKLAKDLGVDVADVPASGPIVTRADVEAYASLRGTMAMPAAADGPPRVELQPEAAVEPQASDQAGDVRVPVRGVRKAMSEVMVASARTVPHATEWVTVDVSRTVDWIARLHREPEFDGIRLTPTVITAKAVCMAMRHTPSLNARWIDSEAGDAELLMRQGVNLGIAVATDRGLIVPNIKGADAMSLVELAGALTQLTATARAGETQPADCAGGSFTITNIGVFGVDAGTPILNLGEAGILAVGAIQRRPWVADDDTIVPRWVTTLALSFDHRIVDGAEGARFLTDVAAILHDPATALTY